MSLTALKVDASLVGNVDVGGVSVGRDLIRFGGKDVDQRTIDAAGAVFHRGANVTFYQPAPAPRLTKAERKTQERAEREQAVLDRAYEMLVLIRDSDTPLDGRFFREAEEKLETAIRRIQSHKDEAKKYYRTSNEGIPSHLIYDYIERLDRDFAAQKEDWFDYSKAAGYRTELAKAKFNAVRRFLHFALNLWEEQREMLAPKYQQNNKSCMIL